MCVRVAGCRHNKRVMGWLPRPSWQPLPPPRPSWQAPGQKAPLEHVPAVPRRGPPRRASFVVSLEQHNHLARSVRHLKCAALCSRHTGRGGAGGTERGEGGNEKGSGWRDKTEVQGRSHTHTQADAQTDTSRRAPRLLAKLFRGGAHSGRRVGVGSPSTRVHPCDSAAARSRTRHQRTQYDAIWIGRHRAPGPTEAGQAGQAEARGPRRVARWHNGRRGVTPG